VYREVERGCGGQQYTVKRSLEEEEEGKD